jgi:haloalkane dehalogenase
MGLRESKHLQKKEGLSTKENKLNKISSEKLSKKFIKVFDKKIAYHEAGEGDPIIFQHGNPTSSYLWRNIIPHLSKQGRCIAIDLIGMGDSDKLSSPQKDSYDFKTHKKYFDECLKKLNVNNNVTLVIHDWGSALGFLWASENSEKIKGIAYMEAIVKELSWSDWDKNAKSIFQGFRSDAGENLILNKNIFVEGVLPGAIIRDLEEEEMNIYREPFIKKDSRQPTLDWPRQIPIDGEPKNICSLVNDYSEWMSKNTLPKLFINADPGSILTGKQRGFCRKWKNQTEKTVRGLHFIQEDSPHEIGKIISSWYKEI